MQQHLLLKCKVGNAIWKCKFQNGNFENVNVDITFNPT